MLKAIFGLGNPEPEYEWTRHNAGYVAADYLKLKQQKDSKLHIIKPAIYINDSGLVVKKFCEKHKLRPNQILIILDCLAIPLGELRFRRTGSFGGHNGMKSIIEELGTTEIPRIRMGVGAVPYNMDISDFVTGRFKQNERAHVSKMCSKICNFLSYDYEAHPLTTDNQYTKSLNKEVNLNG